MLLSVTTEFNILPIFDQRAPGVWDDLWRVKSEAWLSVYRRWPDAEDKAKIFDIYDKESRAKTNAFAFGAYAKGKLIGYIRGICKGNDVLVHDLYVLPRFHRQRVGKRLMYTTECTFKTTHRYVKLTAMETSEPFYIKQGFSSPTGDMQYIKRIKMYGIYNTVPVFKYSAQTWAECSEFAAKYNITLNRDDVDKLHAPVFIYRGDNDAIEGIAVIKPGKNDAQIAANSPWVKKQTTRAAEQYLQHRAQQNNR